MPATVTLSTTTLSAAVGPSDQQVKVASTSDVLPGLMLFIEGELMEVTSLGIDTWVNVLRGRDGTAGAAHDSDSTIYIGRADQFFRANPPGVPAEAIPVSPHINVVEGSIWFARGDTLPEGQSNRWWQKQSVSYTEGPLGVRVETLDPTAST